MKTKIFRLFLVALMAVVVFSCNKEDDPKPEPVASFTSSATEVEVGEQINFTNTSTNATSFSWSFGDGTSSTLEAPSKSYSASGVYTVTLVATGEGGSANATEDITVVDPTVDLPVADFTSSSTAEFVGESFTFTNTSTHATSYSWDFGDGDSSTEDSPVKNYTAAGTYTVTLTATNESGTDETTFEVTVLALDAQSIFVSDAGDELILQVATDGSGAVRTVKDIAGKSGVGLAYDNVNNKIFYSDYYDADTPDGKIWSMNFDGTGEEALVTGLLDPYGISLDLTNNKVYWADDAGNIGRANLDGTSEEPAFIYTELSDETPGWMRAVAADPDDDKLYYYEVWEENLIVANLSDGTVIDTIVSGAYGYAIFIDKVNGKVYYDDQYTGFMRANLDGSGIEMIEDIGDNDTRVYGIDIDYTNSKLYWSARDAGEIYKANLDGTGKEVIATGLSSPRGIFLK